MKWSQSILVLAAVLFSVQLTTCTTLTQEEHSPRRALKVILYPFVPAKDALFHAIEQEFETAHPLIDLQIVDLESNYYETEKAGAITNTEADVYELDSIFLVDLVKGERLQPLPDRLRPAHGQFVRVAEQASQYEGTWYGVPHWICTNFLFFQKGDALQDAGSFADLERMIGSHHDRGKGLLIDIKGKSTIGELYLDALIDNFGSLEKAAPYLYKEHINQEAEATLGRAVSLCDTGYCRNDDYHKTPGFYARRFARHDGRALVGYSERLFYVLDERLKFCRNGVEKEHECVDSQWIDFIELPLSASGSQPFAWVDTFAIAKVCSGQCLDDATAFIAFVTSKEQVKQSLLPAEYSAPRYLLPAHVALYTDDDLKKKSPLYRRMLSSIQRALPVTGYQLNTNLREIGKELDQRLSK
jgi:thiamine pyridinylase